MSKKVVFLKTALAAGVSIACSAAIAGTVSVNGGTPRVFAANTLATNTGAAGGADGIGLGNVVYTANTPSGIVINSGNYAVIYLRLSGTATWNTAYVAQLQGACGNVATSLPPLDVSSAGSAKCAARSADGSIRP
jgi:hypothetical protein